MKVDEAYLRIIVQYFNDPTNTGLQAEVLELRAQSPGHEEFYQQVFKLWTSSAELKDLDSINVGEATERLSVKIRQTERYQQQRTSKTIPLFRWMLRAAAAIVVGIAGYWWYAGQGDVSYLVKTTGAGIKDSVRLSDGTLIFLDELTELRYPESLQGAKRTVQLEKGNAFFSVAHDAAHPFIVTLGKSSVTVLGTSFNIRTNPEEIYVSVKTGTVRFEEPQGVTSILNAGKGIVFTLATKELEQLDVTNQNADAWLTHELNFVDASLQEVLTSLEQYYNVQISLTDSIANFRKFNATFRNNKLQEVLNVLEATYPIKVETRDNQVVIKSVHER